ncbi:MAG: hypothetical protein E4H13_15185, partial [Calditrichales bacterium]
TGITFIQATSALPDEGELYKYGPEQAFDNNPATAWNEGTDGNGEGEQLTVYLDRPTRIDAIEFMAGYFDAAYYRANNRVRRILIEFLDNTGNMIFEKTADLQDRMIQQKVQIGERVISRVRFTVIEVYPGEQWNDLAIAEIGFSLKGTRVQLNLPPDLAPVVLAESRPLASAQTEKIVFNREAGTSRIKPDIYIMNADGSGIQNLTNSKFIDVQPAYSNSQKLIAFTSDRSGKWGIHTMNIQGANVQNAGVAENDCVAPAWSPDGNKLAFIALSPDMDDPKELIIYVRDFSASNRGQLKKIRTIDGIQSFQISFRPGMGYDSYLDSALAEGIKLRWQKTGILHLENDFTFAAASTSLQSMQQFFREDGTPISGKERDNLTILYNTSYRKLGSAVYPFVDGDNNISQNGKSLYFTSVSDGDYEIYRINTDGTNLLKLTNNSYPDYSPVVVPSQ